MITNIKSLLLVILLPVLVQAQDTLKLNLYQAIEYGIANRYDLKSKDLNITISTNNESKLKKEWIPEVSVSSNLKYNAKLQKTIMPSGFGGSTSEQEFEFGTKNNLTNSIDFNQVIYKPGIVTDIKIAQNITELEIERNKESKTNIKIIIAEAYLNVLLKELQYKMALDNENRNKVYFEIADGKMKLGKLIETDYLRTKLDYETAKSNSNKSKQTYQLAIMNLKYILNVQEATEIVLTASISSLHEEALKLKNTENEDPYDRTELLQLQLQLKGYDLNITKIFENNLPTVSLFANYSKQYQSSVFDFSDKSSWSNSSFVGLKISVPVTQYFKNSNSDKEYKIKSQQTQFDLKQKEADINYEVKESLQKYNNSIENLKINLANYKLSNQVFETQNEQYALGAFQLSNLLDTENSLKTAENDYINAVYDFLIAKINYEKAVGKY